MNQKLKAAMARLLSVNRRVATSLLLAFVSFTAVWAKQPISDLNDCNGAPGAVHVRGWCFDPDVPSKSIYVHVYVYKDAACSNLYRSYNVGLADESSTDVTDVYGVSGNHRFNRWVEVTTPGTYYVKTYALDGNGENTNPEIFKGSTGGPFTVIVSSPYTITYNANGGSNAPAAQTKSYNINRTLSADEPTRDGYKFLGWNTSADGSGTSYAAGATYSANATVTLYAQWFGTEEQGNYLISSEEDWNQFAKMVADGETFTGKTVKLLQTISVTTKVGVVSNNSRTKPFSGTFDGGDNTLTVDITDTSNQGTAPFCFIKDATIHNLTVTGTVTGNAYHASAIVGFAEGTCIIKNCTATATVNCSSHAGGILGHGLNSNITIDSCVFSGKIVGGNNAKGVLFGWGDNGGTKVVSNSLYVWQSGQNNTNLDLGKHSGGSESYTNCYKTAGVGSYGSVVWASCANIIAKQYTIYDTHYYIAATVSGVEDSYDYIGLPVDIEPKVQFDGKDLKADEYTVSYTCNGEPVDAVAKRGKYTITVTANEGSGYCGTWSKTFIVTQKLEPDGYGTYHIASTDDWNDFTAMVNNGTTFSGKTVKLNADIDVYKCANGTFSGIFDGGKNKIKLALQTDPTGCAPFATISNATIKDLVIEGTITLNGGKDTKSGSIAGISTGTCSIIGCLSTVTINCTESPSGWYPSNGGFIGFDAGDGLRFENCVFKGKLLGKGVGYNGGFVGRTGNSNSAWTTSFTNCLFYPEQITMKKGYYDGTFTWIYQPTANSGTAFYIQAYGTEQGTKAYTTSQTVPCKKITILDNVIYANMSIEGIKDTYSYSGEPLDLGYKVSLCGQELESSEYNVVIKDKDGKTVNEAKELGIYTLTISGNGISTFGSKSYTFTIIDGPQGLSYNISDDEYYINLPTNGTKTVTFDKASITTFKVYDDGGKNGQNSERCSGTLVIVAPEGYYIQLEGNVSTDRIGADRVTLYDGEEVFDGYDFINGNATINTLSSSGRTVKIYYYCYGLFDGLDFTITIVPNPYTVHFDKNADDATGSMPDMNFVYDVAKDLTLNAFQYDGRVFTDWNTAQNGSGDFYEDGENVKNLTSTKNEVVTFYAQWSFVQVQSELCKKTNTANGAYYTLCDVSGIDDTYCAGSPVPQVTVICKKENIPSECYTVSITHNGEEVSSLNLSGTYTITITGINEQGCYGTWSKDFTVKGPSIVDNIYIIATTEDWNGFAEMVANGENFSGKTVKLAKDIAVTTKVGVVSGGTRQKPFCGTFDGCGNALDVTITDTNNQGTAPFCFIKNSTIHNLKVTGTVTGGSYHAAAIVGFAEGTSIIKNCTTTATVNGSSHVGGILGHGLSSNVTIDSCMFAGKIEGGSNAKGVLFGWGDDGGTKVISNCLYVQQDGQVTTNLDLGKHSGGSESYIGCYKTASVGELGTLVFTEVQSSLCKKLTLFGADYYATCNISGTQDVYICYGDEPVNVGLVVNCGGKALAETDYAIAYTCNGEAVDAVTKSGEYVMSITGNEEAGCFGTAAASFTVIKGEDVYLVNYELTDAYGDGWNGNAINVIEKVSATTVNTLTISSGSSTTGTLQLCAGEVYNFVWKVGNYGYETGWTFCDADDVEFLHHEGNEDQSAGVVVPTDGEILYQLYACPNPSHLTVSAGTSAYTIALGWKSYDGQQDCWDVAYKAADDEDFTIVEGVTQNPCTVTDVEPDVEYTFKVRCRKTVDGTVFTTKWSDAVTYTLPVPNITLANKDNNSDLIESFDGKSVKVTLADRTLWCDGDWNTLCLPFEVNLNDENGPLHGATARKLNSACITGTKLRLNFGEPVETLEAGVPYLIKWEASEKNIVNPVFEGVTIDATDRSYDSDEDASVTSDVRVQFLGTYDLKTFNDEDQNILFLGAGNTLYYPDGTAPTTVGACRAYFKLGSEFNAAQLSSYSFIFGDEETVSIENHRLKDETDVWYTLDGRRLNEKPKDGGLYIHQGKKVMSH